MQLITVQVMGHHEKQKLSKEFKAIDKNGDGTLSKEELVECYMKVYQDEVKCNQVVDDLFGSADMNNSNGIDYTGIIY